MSDDAAADVVHVLSAGAAKGLVQALAPRFRTDTGATLACTFNAVGAIREALAAGTPCDVLILTQPMLADLARDQRVDGATLASLGCVDTGVAVRSGQPHPAIGDRASLCATFATAAGLYCPDIERSTAGLHFVKVLRELGLWPQVAPKIRAFPSGGIAMKAMAESAEAGLVGCTQVTEILYTPGVALVGVLPRQFALTTVYAAAVTAGARDAALARRLVALLAASDTRALREAGGLRS